MKDNNTVYSRNMTTWQESIPPLLDALDLGQKTSSYNTILIKPNLVEILAPPITTPVSMVETIVDYLLDYRPPSSIIIGEGCGSMDYSTHVAFKELGYSTMVAQKGVKLIDLHDEPLTIKSNPQCTRWPKMYLPELLDEVFLLSVPQLKAHTLSQVTLTMKNMMGCAPPSHYQNGGWNKSAFHKNIHEAIFDLNRYRTPDCTIMDASIGMAQAHLWGPQCNPPVGKIAASFDPVAVDCYGTTLLGRDWRQIGHIAMANGVLGSGEDYECHHVG